MKLVTRELQLALDILQVLRLQTLGDQKKPTSRQDLATILGEPAPFLGVILRKLVKKGYILSSRGARGGYFYVRTTDDARILSLWGDFNKHALPNPLAPKQRASEKFLKELKFEMQGWRVIEYVKPEAPEEDAEYPESPIPSIAVPSSVLG